MDLVLAAVGRAKKPDPTAVLTAEYLEKADRLGRPLGLAPARLVEVEERKALEGDLLKAREAELLLAHIPGGAVLVALDERGKSLSSPGFAAMIEKAKDTGAPALICAVGGADGHGPALLERADHVLSFGSMVWPHMLARVMAAEQLYRAVTILSGHPYHRD